MASDSDAEAAVSRREAATGVLRAWLLARGWSHAQVEALLVGIVTEQEIEARGGDFHFSREGYRPDAHGRVGPPA